MAEQTRDPTSDIAANGSFSGTGGSRYTLLDDHPDSSGADFMDCQTNTGGNIRFGFTAFSVPAGATAISVAIRYYDRKVASGAATIAGRLTVNGQHYAASLHDPSDTEWVLRTDTWATNPNTGAAWTVTEVNTLIDAFGLTGTDWNPDVRVASIQLVATYTEASGSTHSPDSLSHSHAEQGASATQNHVHAPADETHPHALQGAALFQDHTLVPDPISHAQGAGAASAIQDHAVSPGGLAHGHSLAATTSVIDYAFAPDLLGHAHTIQAGEIVLGGAHDPDDLAQAHALGGASMAQDHVLAPDDQTHGHAVAATAGAQDHQVAPVELAHAHALQVATFTTGAGPEVRASGRITVRIARGAATADRPRAGLAAEVAGAGALADRPGSAATADVGPSTATADIGA